jgi:WD40 repeat protein
MNYGGMSKILDLPPTPPAWRRWVPLWLRKLIWLDLVDSYDAFLSYSWAADGQIAEVMQGVLQRFLCPWYKVRAKTVFRDMSCLPMGTSLEEALRERLNRSTHLIVLACPEAVDSNGMEFEAREWFAQKRRGEVLIIVTKGEYRSWSEIRARALPPALRDNLVKPPIWASLDHLREPLLQRQLRRKTRRALVEALQQLFLALYPGRTWGDLLGKERVQRNKALKILSATLLVLLSVTGLAGWELFQAHQQRLLAVSREIASNAESILHEDQSQAMNLAMASWQAWRTPQARLAIAHSFSSLRATLSGRVATFSPDSRFIVTGEKNGTVRIWKSGIDQPVELKGHTAEIEQVAFSPDGKWVLTASDDRTARLWNVATGKPAATLGGHTGEVYCADFSPDGHWMATGGADGHVFLWNVDDPRSPVAKAAHEKDVNHLGFSPDGKLLLTASDDHTARLWATAGLTPVATLSGHTDTIWDAQFSPDGTRIVTASGDNSARLWDAHGQFIKALRGHASSVTRAIFTADSKRILTASRDGTARLWSAAGEPLATLQASDTIDSNQRAVNDANVSHNGAWIVTASEDGSVKVWSAASGQILAVLSGHTAGVDHAEFSPDDHAIVTAGDDATRTWNLTAPEVVLTFGDETRVCTRGALSPDGEQLLIGGCAVGESRILSMATGAVRLALADNILEPVWSPNGNQILAGQRVLDASTGKPLYDLTGHTSSVFDT